MKSIYLAALLPAALILGGCGSAEDEVCRYYVKQDLDAGNYQAVINKLESNDSCKADYPENEYYVDLGVAYLGRAGLTLPRVMSAMIEDEDEDDGGDTEEFSRFLEEVTAQASDSALLDLSQSRAQFVSYFNEVECADLPKPTTDVQDGICLLTSFVDILKTTMAIDAMTGGTISEWVDNPENPAMLRSTCALQYAFEHKNSAEFSTPYTDCVNDTTIEDVGTVTFSDGETSRTYNNLLVTKEEEQYFLENTELGTTVFTSGFCRTDYSECSEGDDNCYVCPINKEGEELQIQDFVLDALNSGFANMDTLIENIGSGDDSEDLQEALDDFKREISCGESSINCTVKDNFTMDDILDYLNKNQ